MIEGMLLDEGVGCDVGTWLNKPLVLLNPQGNRQNRIKPEVSSSASYS